MPHGFCVSEAGLKGGADKEEISVRSRPIPHPEHGRELYERNDYAGPPRTGGVKVRRIRMEKLQSMAVVSEPVKTSFRV